MNLEPTRCTVIVLPGGRPRSWRKSRAFHLSSLRMRPITRRLRRELDGECAVYQVRYRFRGWNAPTLPAVSDVLGVLAKQPKGPVILVGHSMGGRVAAHVSAQADIAGIVALAPWWPEQDGELIRAPRVLTIHGTADTWTSASVSAAETRAMAARGIAARFLGIDGSGHFMLSNPGRWHRLTCDAVTEIIRSGRAFSGKPARTPSLPARQAQPSD
ncbi:MAG: alpha/beta hydrolase [Nocardiaceae bacterium]|nr:alpha/beta hydrolase [Nocardiaceae bacterium]